MVFQQKAWILWHIHNIHCSWTYALFNLSLIQLATYTVVYKHTARNVSVCYGHQLASGLLICSLQQDTVVIKIYENFDVNVSIYLFLRSLTQKFYTECMGSLLGMGQV